MSSRAGALTGLRILVVDDNDDARQILRRLLTHFGAVVTTAASAQEALKLLAKLAPSVVITDMFMEPGDGRGLLRQARERGTRAPFIAISTGDFDGKELTRSGFAAYLRKPLDHEPLVETILDVVARTKRSS